MSEARAAAIARMSKAYSNASTRKVKKWFAIACCFGFIAIAFADINGFIEGARNGLELFERNVLGILFPFFFITSLLVELGFFSHFKRTGPAVFALSLLGGYPTGARMLSSLYAKGEISRTQAIRISTYTSTSSPIFTIATLGVCFYGDIIVGVVIFACHITAALVNGIIYKGVKFPDIGGRKTVTLKPQQEDIAESITNSLYSAVQSILAVGGLIVVFFILSSQIQNLISLPDFVKLPFFGILEMTNGVFLSSLAMPLSSILNFAILIPCAIITFGGLAVAMQGFLFLKTFRMPFSFYLLYKTTHTLIAVLLCLALLLF